MRLPLGPASTAVDNKGYLETPDIISNRIFTPNMRVTYSIPSIRITVCVVHRITSSIEFRHPAGYILEGLSRSLSTKTIRPCPVDHIPASHEPWPIYPSWNSGS